MAPAREGAEGAPIARREGGNDSSSRDDIDFFTPRAALVFGACMVGALFWEEAVELRVRATEVMFGEKAEGPVFFAPRRAGTTGTAAVARSELDGEGGAPVAPRVPAAPFPDEADDDDDDFDQETPRAASSNDSSNDSSEDPTTSYPPPGSLVALPEVPEAVGGAWRSLGRVRALGDPPDVTKDDASIRAAAERRAFRGEIIVMVANSRGCHLAANAIANLRSVGIEHYLLVTNTKEACEGMRRARGPRLGKKNEGASWGVECGWTSFLLGHPRLETYGLTRGEERADPFRLWWARFHLLERLVAFGYNPMYVDTDVSFRVNPYPLLKGPFANFSLVGQDETGHVNGVNIGFVYAQNARVGGPAHRVLNETISRMFAILEHAPDPVKQWDGGVARGAKEHLWDQHIYNDVIESAVFSRDLRRRSGARLIDPSGNKRQLWNDDEANAFPKNTDWESFEVLVREKDVPLTASGTKMALEPGTFQARGARLKCVGADVPGYATSSKRDGSSNVSSRFSTLNETASSVTEETFQTSRREIDVCVEPELFLASPPWFLAGWSGVAGDERFRGVRGAWVYDPPIVAVAHFVGALAKQQTFKQLGWWQYGAEAFTTPGLPSLAATQSKLDRKGALGVKRLRAATAATTTDPAAGAAAYGEAVARLVSLAVALGRRPAIPEIACDSPWIKKEPGAFLGIMDRERVVVGARCDASGALVAEEETKKNASGPFGGKDGSPIAQGSVSCCATVNFACDEGVVWQVDLDNDPRFKRWREGVRSVDVSALPRVANEPDVVDVVAASTFLSDSGLDDAPLLVLDLERSDGIVPNVGNVSPETAETVNAFFYACDRLDCRPPRRPFPTDVDPCRVPR
jgi:hypothetical protein